MRFLENWLAALWSYLMGTQKALLDGDYYLVDHQSRMIRQDQEGLKSTWEGRPTLWNYTSRGGTLRGVNLSLQIKPKNDKHILMLNGKCLEAVSSACQFKECVDSEQQLFSLVPATAPHSQKIDYSELTQSSDGFERNIAKFPLTSNTIQTLKEKFGISEGKISEDAQGVSILLDIRTYELIGAYLWAKKSTGTSVEQSVYGKMTTEDLIDRLLQKRSLAFYGASDVTLFRGSKTLRTMAHEWTLVGSANEGSIKMTDYLTYGEMELAALISVCTPTWFINEGSRKNSGQQRNGYPIHGYYIGAVGARFERPGRMEDRHMCIRNGQPPVVVHITDLTSMLWRDFYDLTDDLSMYKSNQPVALYLPAYKLRVRRVLEPVILHGNAIGLSKGKKVVLRLVGLGLGVWAIDKEAQTKAFCEVVKEVIKANNLRSVSIVEMQWIAENLGSESIKDRLNHTIKLSYTKGNPADPVADDHIFVSTYAWDGNAFPGNEYWAGLLTASGDPAAAACSTIQQVQNPLINKCLQAHNALHLY